MGAGAWKVAYADFVTAMMAFFLLMWILSMASKETQAGIAEMFKADAAGYTNVVSPIGSQNIKTPQPGKLTTRNPDQERKEKNNLAIMKAIQEAMNADGLPSAASGTSSDGAGVMLNLTPDLLFLPGTTTFTPAGYKILDQVIGILAKYSCYLVVRGHADSSETGAPNYPSSWELSAARSNAAVEYLINKGVKPILLRSIAYADTKPVVPPTVPNAAQLNGRVEFVFHRPEVMSTISNF